MLDRTKVKFKKNKKRTNDITIQEVIKILIGLHKEKDEKLKELSDSCLGAQVSVK
jgi:hypothetical protein